MRSGPIGWMQGSPIPFGDPRASSYPQSSLRQGHSWAGSGQSARLRTSVLARVALKAGVGVGAQNQPLPGCRRLLSGPQAQAALRPRGAFPLSPWEKPAEREGQVGPSCLHLFAPQPKPHSRVAFLEGHGVFLPRGSCRGASHRRTGALRLGGCGQAGAERTRLQRTRNLSAGLQTRLMPRHRTGERLKSNSIKISKNIWAGGAYFLFFSSFLNLSPTNS